MEQRDYFNGIYVTEDNDGTVYRWRVHRGELFTLPESTYGAELIDSLDLSITNITEISTQYESCVR